jgi:hypothetical protein
LSRGGNVVAVGGVDVSCDVDDALEVEVTDIGLADSDGAGYGGAVGNIVVEVGLAVVGLGRCAVVSGSSC